MPNYSGSKKYPRTPHFQFSPGATNDDRIQHNLSLILGNEIIITEKLDGSNACLEKEGVFARTHSHAPTHPSFDHLKAFHQSIKRNLPRNTQFFGENLYATHSIAYSELPGFFLLFAVRDWSGLEDEFLNNDEENRNVDEIDFENECDWFSWDRVKESANQIGVPTVPVLWEGRAPKTEKELQKLVEEKAIGVSECGEEKEGVVVRVKRGFLGFDFDRCVLKWVRKNHVNIYSKHWSKSEIIKNKLK